MTEMVQTITYYPQTVNYHLVLINLLLFSNNHWRMLWWCYERSKCNWSKLGCKSFILSNSFYLVSQSKSQLINILCVNPVSQFSGLRISWPVNSLFTDQKFLFYNRTPETIWDLLNSNFLKHCVRESINVFKHFIHAHLKYEYSEWKDRVENNSSLGWISSGWRFQLSWKFTNRFRNVLWSHDHPEFVPIKQVCTLIEINTE